MKHSDLLQSTQDWLRNCYDTIQRSREMRRDLGHSTGWTIDIEGRRWFRQVDPLPSYEEWLKAGGIEL